MVFAELETHYTVGMTRQSPCGASTATPVAFDGHTLAKNDFPRFPDGGRDGYCN